MKKLALLGRKLGHTFSPKYFAEKFKREKISGYEYRTMELENITDFPAAWSRDSDLIGCNVTIPYKTEVIPYLDELDETAGAIGAVNTIRIHNGYLKGYNTDVIGFRRSLLHFLPTDFQGMALVLGTGGSSKAVGFVLQKLEIPFKFVSRNPIANGYTYDQLDETLIKKHRLIVNTTPLGMYPDVERCPDIPYSALGQNHYLFDLIYNPEVTLFMEKGQARGAQVRNGYDMLVQQAEASWEIWNRAYGT